MQLIRARNKAHFISHALSSVLQPMTPTTSLPLPLQEAEMYPLGSASGARAVLSVARDLAQRSVCNRLSQHHLKAARLPSMSPKCSPLAAGGVPTRSSVSSLALVHSSFSSRTVIVVEYASMLSSINLVLYSLPCAVVYLATSCGDLSAVSGRSE